MSTQRAALPGQNDLKLQAKEENMGFLRNFKGNPAGDCRRCNRVAANQQYRAHDLGGWFYQTEYVRSIHWNVFVRCSVGRYSGGGLYLLAQTGAIFPKDKKIMIKKHRHSLVKNCGGLHPGIVAYLLLDNPYLIPTLWIQLPSRQSWLLRDSIYCDWKLQ